MKDIVNFLTELDRQGIRLWNDDGRLRYKLAQGTLSPDVREQLVQRKEEILAFLDQTCAAPELPEVIPDSSERHRPFHLTDIQEAYWIGRRGTFELGQTSTHSYFELESRGLDLDRLNRSLQKVIHRHEMLRAIVLPSGEQKILEYVPEYKINCLNLEGKEPEAVAAELAAVRERMSAQVLPADRWPLFEIRATRFDGHMRLHFSIDLMMLDVASYKILFREWETLYRNPEHILPSFSLSFRDYLIAEKKIEASELYKQARTYWMERIDALPAAPDLPLVCEPASLGMPQFKNRSYTLSAERWQRLKKRGTQAGLSSSVFLLTAFTDILTAWSKKSRFTLNLTLFNRLPLHPDVNNIIGDFTSITLLAIDNPSPVSSFEDRAKKIRQQLWQDLDRRYYSGIRVLRELNRRRSTVGQAAMPVVFTGALDLPQKENGEGSSIFGKSVFDANQTPQVWLDHQAREENETLIFNWAAVDNLFFEGMLDDMFAEYCALLERLTDDETAWSAISRPLIPASQAALQRTVNETAVSVSDELLHTLFLQQATTYPDRTAVVSCNRTLSYKELRREAVLVAHQLIGQGVDPNQPVAVVMEKGWEQVVAVLGILISGAAYLPIDPELPVERQHYLLEQGGGLVLTQLHLDARSDWPETVQRLIVEQKQMIKSSKIDNLPEVRQTSDSLAYVIYTSGSTGTPKGVATDHRGAVNTILDVNRRFQVTPQDKMLALSALNFDLSVYDIFGVLSAGGTVIIPDPTRRRDPQHWAELMTRHGVTLWNTVPAFMQMLVDYQAGRHLDVPLRLAMMSGDWIPLDLPDCIWELWPDADLISLGGATEASIWSIYYPIKSVNPAWKSIPYGKPMDNQTFHVLNERLDPCPVQVPGQLFIGGIGLALGYWQDEEKTAAAFFIHPRTGERLYRTGDMGCLLPDGNIEFLGREDTQVKIRGHRIELGEIEACLNRCPDVKEAVITVIGEEVRKKQLAAYIVPKLIMADEQDYVTEDMKGTLTDPAERTEFTLNQPGLRQFDDSVGAISLHHISLDRTTYLARQSYRHFQQDSLPVETLSRLLAALQPRNFSEALLPKYRYGSAGSLYPVQTYIWIKSDRVAELAGGLYYYDPPEHRLVPLSKEAPVDESLYGGMNRKISTESAFSIFLISRMSAIEPMYGKMSRDFCLLEAGYMSQLLMEESHQHGIGLCPIGGMRFEPIRPYFKLNDDQELLHSFLGGAVSEEQKTSLPAPTDAGSSELEEEIKSFLRGHLPLYMVPDYYMMLEKLPLTTNGKVDRKALPVPNIRRTAEQREAPVGEIEQQFVEIVKSVLRKETIGVTDNFFDLGANSLDIIRFHNEIEKQWGVEINVTDLFQMADVRQLSKLIKEMQGKESQEVILGKLSLPKEIPLSFSQEERWMSSCRSPENYQFWTNVFLIKIIGNIDLRTLKLSFEELAQRHDTLRTLYPLKDGKPIQKIVPKLTVNIPLIKLDHKESEIQNEIDRIIQQEKEQPLDLINGPIWRVKLIQVEDNSYVMSLCIHHINGDATSNEIFFRELFSIYDSISSGQPADLVPLTIQYADFAYWQRSYYTQERLEKCLEYFERLLTPEPSRIDFSSGRNEIAETSPFPSAVEKLRVAPELFSGLKALSSETGATLFAIVSAAVAAILYRYKGSEDILFGAPMSRRLHKGLELLIGDFSGMMLLRLGVKSDMKFSELLGQSNKAVQSALTNQELNYKQVATALNRKQYMKKYYSVALNYLPVETLKVETDYGKISAFPYAYTTKENNTMMNDLSVFVRESNCDSGTFLNGGIRYRSDLFEPATIKGLKKNFITLLESVVTDPLQSVSKIRLDF